MSRDALYLAIGFALLTFALFLMFDDLERLKRITAPRLVVISRERGPHAKGRAGEVAPAGPDYAWDGETA